MAKKSPRTLVKYNDIEGIKLYHHNGGDITTKDNNGFSLLHSSQTIEMTSLLIELGADHFAKSNKGWTCLHYATDAGSAELLINMGLDINATSNDGCPVIHKISKRGKLEVMKILAKHGADLNQTHSEYETTPLYEAAQNSQAEIVKYLLAQGINPNQPHGKWKGSALMVANSAEVAEALILGGADPKQKDAYGNPVIFHHCTGHEADVRNGTTSKIEIVKLLLSHGASINESDSENRYPLHQAVLSLCPTLTKFLLENGADPNVYTQFHGTPLDYANHLSPCEKSEIHKSILIQFGAKTSAELGYSTDNLFSVLDQDEGKSGEPTEKVSGQGLCFSGEKPHAFSKSTAIDNQPSTKKHWWKIW